MELKQKRKIEEAKRQRILKFYNYPLKDLTNEQIALVKIYMELNQKTFRTILYILLDYEKTREEMEKELKKRITVKNFKMLAELEKIDLKTEELGYSSDILFVHDVLKEHNLFNLHDAPFAIDHKFITEVKAILNTPLD